MTPIPISAAKEIAERYGYDQVIIVARKVGRAGSEAVTTYGRNKAHCDVAARVGDFLKSKVMGWHESQTKDPNGKPPMTQRTATDILAKLQEAADRAAIIKSKVASEAHRKEIMKERLT